MVMEIKKRPRILVAPLDWGLGHATRCIPIINQLLNTDCEIIIASSGHTKHLFEQEFPGLQIIDLPGYRVNYSKKSQLNLIKIISQIPKILIQIKREKKWLEGFISKEKPDGLISDNRYGLYSHRVYSVFITHQLHIEIPFGQSIANLLSGVNYRFMNRFSLCWIPDFADGLSLSGKLGHPEKLPKVPVKYIGPLSRFKEQSRDQLLHDFIIILSGPEPQRSIFETIVFNQLRNYKGSVIVVRGLPDQSEVPFLASNILVYNHLSSEELNRVICQSEIVISRSGYSTIMDVVGLGKKSIMVPTPGQPEQQYLAQYLFEKKIVYRVKQDEFILQECLNAVKTFPFLSFRRSSIQLLPNAIEELLNKIDER
jgi:uncharacterized protein (TIGR00661 family)